MAQKHPYHWIENMHLKPGALHRELRVPAGQKIPEKKLVAAEHAKNPTERHRADVAATLRGLPHK